MIRWLLCLVALPVAIVLQLLEWGGTSILSIVGMLCKLASGTIRILTIAAYLTGIASRHQVVNALVAGFTFYLIPRIGGVIICGITLMNAAIIGWINS